MARKPLTKATTSVPSGSAAGGREGKLIYGTSQRGHKTLILSGYSYVVDRSFKDTKNWRCASFRTMDCKARAVTHIVEGVEALKSLSNKSHSHPSNLSTRAAHNYTRFRMAFNQQRKDKVQSQASAQGI